MFVLILRIEWSLLLLAIIDDWMVPFAANTAAQTANAFKRAEQPPKIAASSWGILSQSNTWFLGPTHVSPQTASLSIQPFSQGLGAWPTDRHTQTYSDRQTETHRQTDHTTSSVATSYAMDAMWPKKWNRTGIMESKPNLAAACDVRYGNKHVMVQLLVPCVAQKVFVRKRRL